MATNKRVFITGISGHIGNSLARLLLQVGGWDVLGMAHRSSHQQEAIFRSLKIDPFYGDICDEALLQRAFRGADVVVHCAGKIDIAGDTSGEVERVNVEGTRTVVRAIKKAGAGRLVHFSSIHARDYDSLTPRVDEETPLALTHRVRYNRSKATAEQYVLTQNEIDNVVVLSPTGVIGPNDHQLSEMGEVLIRIAKNKQPFLIRGGFDWVDVRDICSATLAAMQSTRKREGYLLNGHFVLLKDVANTIATVRGVKITAIALPLLIAHLGIPVAALYGRITKSVPKLTRESLIHITDGNNRISHEKARKHFQYNPRPFNDTIASAIAWYRDHGGL